MIQVLINNLDLKSHFGITVTDYSSVFSFAAERENKYTWNDKSGIERNRANIRYDTNDFNLGCIVKAPSLIEVYEKVAVLIDYMFGKGLLVLSLRDTQNNKRACFLVQRNNNIQPIINERAQNSIYSFRLFLKDVNPNAIKYYSTIEDFLVEISYTKGQNAFVFWGDGTVGEVSNSGNYKKEYALEDGLVDIIIDVDKDSANVTGLTANFSANKVTGIVPETIQFTDSSMGSPVIWAWNFGDGGTSSLQNPTHTYSAPGIYPVTLQIFNVAQGTAIKTQTNYINIRNSRVLINNENFLLINSTNKLLNN